MIKLVLGGPGCGKTSYLLSVVEKALRDGVPPDRIGYVAFTKRAASEARERMVSIFGILPDEIPYFSTLHSLAFKQLGLRPEQVMSDDLMLRFATSEGFDLSTGFSQDDEFQVRTDDDRCLAAIHFSRLTRKSLDEVSGDFEAYTLRAKFLAHELAMFKQDQGLLDYTDMIEQFISEGVCPHFDLLIVDEAQDLSRLQWEMVGKLREGVPDVYYGGDDDQAIYHWAGADLETFLSLEGERIVLPKSYRLPSKVFDVCQHIVSAVSDRYEKTWTHRGEGGRVEFISHLNEVDLGNSDWMILARNLYLLKPVKAYLWDIGIPYVSSVDGTNRSSVDLPEVRAILIWERLRKGVHATADEVTFLRPYLKNADENFRQRTLQDPAYFLSDLLEMGVSSSDPWLDTLHVPPSVKQHVRLARERGESLTKKPRILVSTIHGVKGGEATNVLIKLDISNKCLLSYHNEPSNESRVFFVGASRAKENLYFLDPQTSKYYDLNGRIS